MKQLLTLFLLMYMSLSAMASETSVLNAEGVEIWYDFDSSTKKASVTYKGGSGESYSNEYTGEVVIPSTVTYEGVEYSVTRIGSDAFYYCRGLISVTIPESVTSIGDYAFSDCNSLTSITLPEGVTSIGDDAFYNCDALTSITLPEGVTSIGDDAFRSCNSLTSITLPESLTSIGGWIFAYCSSLTSITLPKGVTSIGNDAFYSCSALTSITLPEGVTSIGYYAFSGCNSLTSITLPESLTSIGYEAFYNCYKLYEVYNKSNLTITAGNSDNGSVAYYAKNVYTDSEGESKLKTVGDYIFYVDGEDIELIAYTGSETSITLPSDYEGKNYNIGDYAFYECEALKSITLPEGVTEIGAAAFYGCSGLLDISLPASLDNIRMYSFYECSSLSSIKIPEGISLIEYCTFSNCTKLESITLPSTLSVIDDYAFQYCTNLHSIKFPKYVSKIGKGSFRGCNGLTNIISLNTTPPMIGDNETFKDVDKTISVYVPKSSVDAYKNAEYWKDFTNIVGVYYVDVIAENGTVDGTGVYKENDEATLTATPNEGYKFVQWSDGVIDNPRTIVVTSDLTFTAVFEIKEYTLTIEAENGIVEGAGTYKHGDEATLTVTPNEGYKFVQWSDGVTDNPRAIVVVSDTTFTAVFELKEYTVAVTAKNGTVEGVGTYKHGAEATLIVTPIEGYKFVKWSDGVTDNSRTIEVTSDLTLTAEIYKLCSVYATTENGFISGAGEYVDGDEVTLTATPFDGYEFFMWRDKYGNAVSFDANYTFTVTSDVELTAVFKEDDNPISDIQTSDVKVRIFGSSIVVDGADDYTVYSISGQNLGKVERVERGIYIVVVNGKSYKVIAK